MRYQLPLIILLLLSYLVEPLAQAAPPLKPTANAQVTASGLAYEIVQSSANQVNPGKTDLVTVHYEVWTTNGQMVDSSIRRGQAVTLPLDQVIPGWSEGLQLMQVGEKAHLWIPAHLAYGNTGRPGAPTGDLIFEVELLAIKQPIPPPPVPDNLTSPPAAAVTEASGLRSLLLNAGNGTAKPTANSVVKVHYTGWTMDGRMFDSSVVRDEPLIAPLNRVIPGWSEGIQLMVVGEKRRLWIPASLAYGNTPPGGAPAGQLLFDVELLEIVKQ